MASEESALTSGYDFVAHLTRFCRALRGRGFLVGPQEVSDAVRALGMVDSLDRARVYWTLRGVLMSRHEETGVFDEMFGRFWNFEPLPREAPAQQAKGPAGGARRLRPRPRVVALPEHDSRSDDTLLQILRAGASAREVAVERDLTALRSDELSELSRIASRMVRALASRPGRRRKRDKRKGVPDLRGAFRLNLATGGDPIRLPRMRRAPRTPRLLALLDVSGSMERHARLLLQLVFAVTQHTKRIETFVFSTSVTRVTRQMSAPSFSEALRRVGSVVEHWSGGTRIGECIARMNAEHEGIQDRYTTVFLLSDGWETGDPALLASELRSMRKRVRRVVWLNPLLGTRDYEPLARGLQAVTPYVDDFVSARDIGSLKSLPKLLRG